jgi:hypothetical protein
MSVYDTRQVFGAPRKSEKYYADCRAIISTLRPTATLTVIAQHLNSLNMKTPMNRSWTKDSVSNFARNHNI